MSRLISDVSAWSSPVEEGTARSALNIARAVASKLASSDTLSQAVAATERQTAFPRSNRWAAYSVAQGNAGLALLWAQMDACFPDERWDLLGHEHLALAAQDLEQFAELPLGIFSGLSGVAFAAWQLSRNGTRYRHLLQTLDAAIIQRTRALADQVKHENGCGVSIFDAISGLSGIGAYLLCRADDPECTACLSAVLEGLSTLLLGDDNLPRWHTPAFFIGDERSQQLYPRGWLNCGLAHGIPGPLALLSLAYSQGHSSKHLHDAITRTAEWLCNNRLDDDWGANWPTAIPLLCEDVSGLLRTGSALSAPSGTSRTAWCYGAPGVARALWLAGEATDCERYRHVAVSAMEAVFCRPASERNIDSPTFCHGMAGLLQVSLRFSGDLDGAFSDEIEALLQQILDKYSPEHLVGFRNLEIGTNEIDQPGFLDGASGVAAVLLAAATHVAPTWDRLFLLS